MTIEAYEIYAAFKEVCPNSKDTFEPTPSNLAHWKYQIRTAMDKPEFQKVELDKGPLQKIQAKRKVATFEEFPPQTKLKYLRIASCFPGFQVWAAGSRVDGSYIETWDGQDIEEARLKAGKSKKIQSDYDFVVHPSTKEVYPLPNLIHFKADRLKVRTENKIPIPMWDISKLPESEHKNVIRLLNKNDQEGLTAIHNQYRLSPHDYCCDLLPVVRHFADAVNKGLIK